MKTAFKGQRLLFIFALFVIATVAHADPGNFMVDELTFVRPPKWKWVWEEKLSRAGLLLTIPSGSDKERADVYFRKFEREEGSAENRIKAWRKVFRESNDMPVQSTTKEVGSFTIVYVAMEGTSLRELSPDFGLFAAIIKMKEGHIVVRMCGRKKLIADSKAIFRQMVEQALNEKETN